MMYTSNVKLRFDYENEDELVIEFVMIELCSQK